MRTARPLRVTFLLPGLARSNGGYRVVYTYANALAARGHTVNVVHGDRMQGDLERGRTVRGTLRSILRNRRTKAGPSWFSLAPEVRSTTYRHLGPSRIPPSDVVVATAVQTAPLAAAVAAQPAVAGAYLIQSYEDWAGGEDFVRRTWALPLHRIAVARWLCELGELHGAPMAHVRNAIDADEFPPGPETSRRPIDVLSMVSTQPLKRTDLVVQIFREILRHDPERRLATFGTCGRPEGMPREVDHHQSPSRADLARLYQDAKIYLCTSDTEGWGLPPAEAMSSGCAVVSTDNRGVRDFADGVALFAAPGDGAGLTGLVEELLADPARCARLAGAGRDRLSAYGPAEAALAFEEELLRAWDLGARTTASNQEG